MRLEELIRKNEALYRRYDRLVDKIKELRDREDAPQILNMLSVNVKKLTHTNQTSFSYQEIVEELEKEALRIYGELEEASKEIVRREKNSKK